MKKIVCFSGGKDSTAMLIRMIEKKIEFDEVVFSDTELEFPEMYVYDCIEYLKERNLENPLYQKFSRLGCWLCPKQSKKSLIVLKNDYPKLWVKLLELNKISRFPQDLNKI